MKGRESGMPEEEYWNSFFNVDSLFDTIRSEFPSDGVIVEFGSGYGTFLLEAAKRSTAQVYGFDIEAELVALLTEKCKKLGLQNVHIVHRDFMVAGTGLPSESVDHVMLYNILHIEEPVVLLSEAYRILKPGGSVSVIHWRSDTATPRGPSMEIRPLPEHCIAWGREAGFITSCIVDISHCCPYHYGVIMKGEG